MAEQDPWGIVSTEPVASSKSKDPWGIAATSRAPAATAQQNEEDIANRPGVPGVPQPDMKPLSIGEALQGKTIDQMRKEGPKVNAYGQTAIPQVVSGIKKIRASAPAAWSFKPQNTQQLESGASDVLEGAGTAMSESVLPIGENPGAVIKGTAAGSVGSAVAPPVAKALGASPEGQRLAGDVAGVLPMAAGVAENKPAVPAAEASKPLPEFSQTARQRYMPKTSTDVVPVTE